MHQPIHKKNILKELDNVILTLMRNRESKKQWPKCFKEKKWGYRILSPNNKPYYKALLIKICGMDVVKDKEPKVQKRINRPVHPNRVWYIAVWC
jgi:hypothetical protein